MPEYRFTDNIKRKIRDNVLKIEPKHASKNLLWQNFIEIFEEADDDKKVVIPFVTCIKCSSGPSRAEPANEWVWTGRALQITVINGPGRDIMRAGRARKIRPVWTSIGCPRCTLRGHFQEKSTGIGPHEMLCQFHSPTPSMQHTIKLQQSN